MALPWSHLQFLGLCLGLYKRERLDFEVRLTISEFGEGNIFHFQVVLKNNFVDLGFRLGAEVVIAYLDFSDAVVACQ